MKRKTIHEWLNDIDLGRYADIFVEHEVEVRDLQDLTDEDLRELGLPLGPRKRIQRASSKLQLPTVEKQKADIETTESDEISEPPASTAAERRQLTVLFCDLVGSTELARKLDPEDLREIMLAYQDQVVGAITLYDGYVGKFLGDGVMAFFGWPTAFEDAAARATNAGLEIMAGLEANSNVKGDNLRTRVGIATGDVVIGDLVGQAATDVEAVTGQPPNLAARLQAVAKPGEVIVDTTTKRLLGNAFDLKELGGQRLKGYDRPIDCWRVKGVVNTETRFAATRSIKDLRFVGRDVELAALVAGWKSAVSSRGRAVIISGEAGIGKSRLVEALIDEIGLDAHFRLRFQCSPYHTNSSFYPIIRQLEYAGKFTNDDNDMARIDKIESLLSVAVKNVKPVVALIANLLSVPFIDRYGPLELTAQQIKRRTINALLAQITGLAYQRPLLLVLEDAHWIDATSAELIRLVFDELDNLGILIVITQRPTQGSMFSDETRASTIQLERFGERQSGELIEAIIGQNIPHSFAKQIIARTDGIPLFLEELTQSLLERGASLKIETQDIPESLQGTLLARLDQLSQKAREVARVSAVIGRDFTLDLVDHITDYDAREISEAIEELLKARIFVRKDSSQNTSLRFRHALIRDTAYRAQLANQRRKTHRLIATALLNSFQELTNSEPETLAYHASEANMVEVAIDNWRKAGESSTNRLANIEAVGHYQNALTELQKITSSEERDRAELLILLALGVPLVAATGYASDKVEQNFRRAETLCLQLGDAENLFSVRRALWNFFLDKPDYKTGNELAKVLLDAAKTANDPEETMLAYRAVQSVCLYTGDLVGSQKAGEAGIILANDPNRVANPGKYGEDASITLRIYLGWAHLFQGRIKTGLEYCEESVQLAQDKGHPLNEAFARTTICIAYRFLNDVEKCMMEAEILGAVCEQHDIVFWLAAKIILSGWCKGQTDKVEEGLEDISKGQELWRSTGSRIHGPHWHSIAADVCRKNNLIESGLSSINSGLLEAAEIRDQWCLAELHRIKGTLLALDNSTFEAIEELKKAVKIAKKQNAKWFLLRAMNDLVKISQDPSYEKQLAQISTTFDQGWHTVDLQMSRELTKENG